MCSFPMPAPADRPGTGRAGFTLVELLVALVIGGLLSGVILQLVQGQARFVERQSARQQVQQNARGTLEILTSELRAVPAGAILIADEHRIRFRLPRTWGVLCQSTGTGGSGSVWVLVPGNTFPPDFPASPGSTEWGLSLPDPAVPGGWVGSAITAVATGTPACDAGFNFGPNGIAGHQAVRVSATGLPAGVAAGRQVFLHQEILYEVGTASGDPDRLWVKRSNGPISAGTQPMAGPLGPPATPADSGLVFEYWCANGPATTAPGNSMGAGWPNLTGVEVRVTMLSQRGAPARELERAATTVFLRNATGAGSC